MILKRTVRNLFSRLGFHIERRDPLLEQLPFPQSRFLRAIKRPSLSRLAFYHDVVGATQEVSGDVVECGTSAGWGLLELILLNDYFEASRSYYGFDSFEGFSAPSAEDGDTHSYKGYLASPPELVHRVLEEGGVSRDFIARHVNLVKGYFCDTLDNYSGSIALLSIDCDLYEPHLQCLRQLFGKVETGGIIMFDDYHEERWPGAKQAVDEFFANRAEPIQRHRSGWHYVVKGATTARSGSSAVLQLHDTHAGVVRP